MTYTNMTGNFVMPQITNPFTTGRIIKKVRQVLRGLLLSITAPKDKELEIMMNEMEVKVPVNPRSWKRNSALLIYSRYQ